MNTFFFSHDNLVTEVTQVEISSSGTRSHRGAPQNALFDSTHLLIMNDPCVTEETADLVYDSYHLYHTSLLMHASCYRSNFLVYCFI
jgi:hypothetical protein